MPEEAAEKFKAFHAALPSADGLEDIRELGMKKDITK